jgi:hypothetical protein
MMARQAPVSVAVMRRWETHDPGRSCLLDVITKHDATRHKPTKPTERQSPGPGKDRNRHSSNPFKTEGAGYMRPALLC